MKPSLRTSALLLGEFALFAALLFVVRFVLRGHLVLQLDQECTLGGAAVDMLANGIRYPLAAYAPNDYENGFFYSALLVAGSFLSLGRNVLALKLPTHLVVTMGVVATVWLLRSCLDELRLNARHVRWTALAALVVATAFAPREIVFFSTCAVGIGSHAEGCAIDMVLLAVFARGRAGWSARQTAAFWVLMGLAVHVNKGTLVLVLVLAVAELALARSSSRSLIAAALGFLLGSAPPVVGMAGREATGGGWGTLVAKLMANAQNFPSAFVSDVLFLADHRFELLATWLLAIAVALAQLRAAHRRGVFDGSARAPSALAMTLGLLLVHVAGLSVMAQGAIDNYAMHLHPPLVVLTGLLAGWLCAAAATHGGARAGIWTGALLVGLVAVVHRPDALRPSLEPVLALWSNRSSAACSWRLGEMFVRVLSKDLAFAEAGPERQPQQQQERHAIELCRSLSETEQVLDCIGGVGREAHFAAGTIDGAPPAELSSLERRAYAFYFGVRTGGEMTPCEEFRDPALGEECRTAVKVECFIFMDIATRFASDRPLGRPSCDIGEPPIPGYWADIRSELLARPTGGAPELPRGLGDAGLRKCEAIVASCY